MKLTEEDIEIYHFDDGFPENWEVIICKDSRDEAEKMKQQILENQEKAEKWDQYCQMHDFSSALEFSEIFVMAKQNKEKLENIRNAVEKSGNVSFAWTIIKEILDEGKE